MSVWRWEKNQIIFGRLIALCVFFLILGLLIFARLFYLQVLQLDKYTYLADRNRISTRYLAPQRGIITDRFGIKLAENKKNFIAVLVKEESKNYKETFQNFQMLIPLEEDEILRIESDLKNKKAFIPIRLKENLSFQEVALLQLNAPDLRGIRIEENLMRFYLFGLSSAPIVGYVSLLNDQDAQNNVPLEFWELAGYRIGRTGIEQSMEERLKGTPGVIKKEVNAFGRSVRVLEDIAPIAGEEIQLTIDNELQFFITHLMKDEAGSAIVMDVKTGEIRALVSTPPYDSNIFTTPISKNVWAGLIENKKRPLQNKAISGIYSPGSIFKLVVAIAGLESGDINPQAKVNCTGKTTLGNHLFHCWRPHGHGAMTLQDAIMHSCDVYFYEMVQKIPVEKIISVARRLSFGDIAGLEIAGEKKGLLPTPEWKKETKKDAWR
ncbi:MAG: hypothetical protein LBU87_04705, partial [Lactobacillales bacterium]|nr:hypothetical protein [Lactobacillales bacterium]